MKPFLTALVCLGIAFPAYADYRYRCEEDPISDMALIHMRNAWAVRCGFISVQTRVYYEKLDFYISMRSAADAKPGGPVNINAPCEGWVVDLPCPRGCYAATERVLFPEGYYSIPEAMDKGLQSVMGLTSDSTMLSLKIDAQPIGSYVGGNEHSPLLRIATRSRKSLLVTKNHPMVLQDGEVVPAAAVEPGMWLLTPQGADVVSSTEWVSYDGMVFNILPENETPKGNIVVAEGLFTGSIRFQNQWATRTGRLILRDTLTTQK